MELTNKEWKEFVIGKIFDIYSTSSGIDKIKLINFKGNIPYITRTDKNNGYDTFVGTQVPKYKTDKNNVITIGLDTQTIYYQKSFFYTGQNIQILDFKELNKYNALFLIPLLKKQMTKFNWGGNGATLTRLKKTKILLPVNSKGDPDYAFMEIYMKQKETKLLKQYEKQVSEFESVVPLSEKEWSGFEIGKLFNKISAGKSKGLNHLQNVTKGGINYLGATNSNNGVLAYVRRVEQMTHKGNSICFIRNGEGSMGFSVYKAEDFIATSDISVGYADFLNKYIGLFITTVTDKVRGKYNFGYKRNETRLKKEKILLPTNSQGKPDFVYMENYMKMLESEKITQYLEYKKQTRN